MWGGRGRGRGPGGRGGGFHDEDAYFFEEDGAEEAAAATPAPQTAAAGADPLDAFMQGVGAELAGAARGGAAAAGPDPEDLKERDAIDCFYAHRERAGRGFVAASDGGLGGGTQRAAPRVPPAQSTQFPPFERRLAEPHPELLRLPVEHFVQFNEMHDVRLTGSEVPRPILTWEHSRLPAVLLDEVQQLFAAPTPIQSYAVPCMLGGRDLLAVAKTGSGKTLAYLAPICAHARSRRPHLGAQGGPSCLVIVPTRELALQVYRDASPLVSALELSSCPFYGGLDKTQQFKVARRGFDIGIGTCGRLTDIISDKGFGLGQCTLVALDEADRLLEEPGAEQPLWGILEGIRPDRQLGLFTATWSPRVDRIAKRLRLLEHAVRVEVGEVGSTSVTQLVRVVPAPEDKWQALLAVVAEERPRGGVLVIVGSRSGADELAKRLSTEARALCASLHGQQTQEERADVLEAFRAGTLPLLVATDVASRGLHVLAVQTVISYDAPRSLEAHVHRVGRAGRDALLQDGRAYVLLAASAQADRGIAPAIAENLEQNGQEVSQELQDLLGGRRGGAKRPRPAQPNTAGLGAQPQHPRAGTADCGAAPEWVAAGARSGGAGARATHRPSYEGAPKAVPGAVRANPAGGSTHGGAPRPAAQLATADAAAPGGYAILPPQQQQQAPAADAAADAAPAGGSQPGGPPPRKRSIFGNRSRGAPLIGGSLRSAPAAAAQQAPAAALPPGTCGVAQPALSQSDRLSYMQALMAQAASAATTGWGPAPGASGWDCPGGGSGRDAREAEGRKTKKKKKKKKKQRDREHEGRKRGRSSASGETTSSAGR
eukprot:TRINITY_DN6629_c1_g1_i4.p1 TRINITY_DN6629_c1_g1~~TRINITY_DN6629_c1_g1_i4.p1  ORF type:complete len:853 (+),score=186.24 TRINITY_DN6629_c1_g1_i4:79-2559(+)